MNNESLSYSIDDDFLPDAQHIRFSPVPILRFGSNKKLLKCSPSIELVTGYSVEELDGIKDTVFKTLFIYDFDRLKNAVIEIFEGSRSFFRKDEIKMISKHGEEKIANTTLYPIFNNNKIFAVEMVIEDITELKSIKEKINAINRLQLLRDITKGFLNFLSNNVNTIMAQTQILLDSTCDNNTSDGIRLIRDSSFEIAEQVRRVQNSIAQKGYFYEERTESITAVIEDAIEFSKMRFKVEDKENHRKVFINKELCDSVFIKTDTGLLREIIISVILKLSVFIIKEGSIEIKLKDSSDLQLSISVLTNAKGIDVMHSQPIVNIFSGIDIRQSAEKIGLKVFEEESANIYSVRIFFPQRLLTDPQSKHMSLGTKPKDLDIIIVEPDRNLKKILVAVFESLGNRVYAFENGLEALNEFKREPSDIVITDYDITGINGIELAAKVKEFNETTATVILSGWSFDEMSSYQNVADSIMPKPFKLNDLINNISELTKERPPLQ